MKLRSRTLAIAALNSYAAHYAEAFVTLYEDSGLWNEELILEGYRKSAKRIRDEILDSIQLHLSRKQIVGRKEIKHGWYEISFHVDTRLIIVHYSEDKQTNTRWVESISIGRKPIIF